jgi:folate-binding protein YgfZ
MPKVAFSDSYITIWRGNDCQSFLDGISSNLVANLKQKQVIQSAILDKNAKIIDFVSIMNLGGFLAVLGHRPNYTAMLDFITPRILQSDVNITDISELNDVIVSYDENSDIEVGMCNTINDVTQARVSEKITLMIAAKKLEIECEKMSSEFHDWRINNLIPWYGFEIKRGTIPYSCGLDLFVHDSKGCYTGQEILTRMRTRNKGLKTLRRVPSSDANADKFTTKGDQFSLVMLNQ